MSRSIIILSALAVATVPSVAGIYHFSRDRFIDLCPEVLPSQLQEENNGVWKKAQDKLKGESNTTDLTNPFKQLNENLKRSDSQESSDNTGKYLRNACSNLYSETYGSVFSWRSSESEKKLLEQIKKYCFVSIKEMLSNAFEGNGESDNQKTKIEEKLTALRSHNSSGNKDLKLNDKLESLSKETDTSKWQELRDWCKEKYTKGYKGQDDLLWKLVNAYCVSST